MADFNILCPDHYPMKCNLSKADKDSLLTPQKYKGFLIFQYKSQDEWLEPTLRRYFGERTWRLYNAGLEEGTGTKFCNVCRYALASDFGIASLTPLNHNVFQEIGLMLGLQKPLLYLLNPKRKNELPDGKLPFDMDDQIYIEHTDGTSLEKGLDNKIGLLLEKVRLLSGFERDQREHVKEKLLKLSPQAKELLKLLVLEGETEMARDDFRKWVDRRLGKADSLSELNEQRFVVGIRTSADLIITRLNAAYLKYLEELLWE
jgi:hypothetical protein